MNLSTRNITSITLNGFTNAQLILNYLTPQPSQLLSSRNTVPYYSLPRYISSSGGPNTFAAMQASTYNPTITSYGPCPGILPSSQTIVSSSIQLNCIPDKLIIFVRPSLSQTQTPWNVATTFLVIQNISLNFNNSSGLLSSVSQYSLWQMSVENGSTQSWGEFSGWQWKSTDGGYMAPIPTQGSLLVLDFAKDIQLNDWLAPGSIGNFNLQFSLNVINQATIYPVAGTLANGAQQLGVAETYISSIQGVNNGAWVGAGGGVAGQDYQNIIPELVVIPMQSGTFVCDRGTSNVYESLLTKEDVLNTSEQLPYTRHDVARLVGGSMIDKIKTSMGHVLHRHKTHHNHKEHGGAMGASVSGGSMGSAVSGGAVHHKLHKHIRK
jgi:hypothetical protein